MIENIIRKLLGNLSFFYKNKSIYENKKIYYIINKRLKKIKIKQINLKKTHINFNKQIIDLINTQDLSKFLRNKFIQKIFFVHNRLFIIKELNYLRSNYNWLFYKKLLDENNIGDPIRYFLYPKSSGNRINHVYHLAILKKITEINLKKINNIFEFGGGYGCMASIFSRISKKIHYNIFDTDAVNLLQYYYLKHNNLDVGFKTKNKIYLSSKIKKDNKKIDLFLANWSLSETPLAFRNKFLIKILNSKYILICFQEKFENINNLKYFNELKNKIKDKFDIKIIKNKIYKGNYFFKQNHYFFIGKKL
jgi:hypothetical protein